ncbi:ABC transporter ATP-binding protein CydC [Corynebacterium suranareeae]|uniref:ABC transporter ATP-binding protein CydC n=1 Tax=Corynebacterium suranareeae TaxID=2506452 RepID=A0A160PPT4_9CORY|nr:thiol reductant ABC exporter subunit CydC [Corynebacterium suranareeae]BAU95526.1 ABC transporter ATP-binding protein CydC [Corynebacterium suranareeae]
MNSLVKLRFRELIPAVVAGSVTMIASITLTVVSAWLITKAWEMPPVMDLTVAVTAVRALGISRAVFRYIERIISHDLALKAASRARSSAYQRLASSPNSTLTMRRGELLSRLGADIDSVSDVIVRAIIPAGVALLTGLCAVIFTAILSPTTALVLAVGLIAAAIIPPLLAARGIKVAEARRAESSEAYLSSLDLVLSNQAALRVRGEMPDALSKANAAARSYSSSLEAGAKDTAISAASSLWIHGFTVIGVLMVAGSLYADGGHSPQWFAVLVLLALSAFEAVSVLPNAAIARTRAADASRRLSEISDLPEAAPVELTAVSNEPVLRAENLSYGWDSDLGTCDLELPFGARHEIIAPSGSGKTTLLLTLAGLLEPRNGCVLIDDKRSDRVKNAVLFSPEDAHIFATTVRDNLALGAPNATDEDMLSILVDVGLAEWVEGLPDGLGTVLDSGAGSLSGGQRRRLLLARALLSDAPILLLDEPTEHLDASGSSEILSMLASDELPGERAQRTVVIVRHLR